MRTVLVTGGAGFIGSFVAERLLDAGCHVVVVDNLSTGARENVPPTAELILADVRSPAFMAVVGEVRPDTIVHLAAQVNVASSVEDPVADADVNVMGTLRVLEAARVHKVRNFIFSSSAAVYGVPDRLPLREDAPIRPVSPYGVAKAAGEAYVRTYCRTHGLKAAVMRYANVFGPRQRAEADGGVVAKFLDAMLRGAAPVFYGDGTQTRDFIYVKDVAEATARAMEYLDQADPSQYLVVNISHCRETSVRQLYSLLRGMLPTSPEPVLAPPREGDIWRSCLDNQTARVCLGWAPRYSLEEALLETVLSVRPSLRDPIPR